MLFSKFKFFDLSQMIPIFGSCLLLHKFLDLNDSIYLVRNGCIISCLGNWKYAFKEHEKSMVYF